MKRSLTVPILVLLLASTACNIPGQSEPTVAPATDMPVIEATNTVPPTETPAPTNTEAPTAEPTATSEPPTETPASTPTPEPPSGEQPVFGEVLYETSFRSGWPDLSTDHSTSGPAEDVYRFDVEKDWAHWVFTSQAQVGEFYAELVAAPVTCGANDNAYGMIFQYVDIDAFRYFIVTCGGDYALGERNGTRNRNLVTGTLSEGIADLATGEHTIGVWARGTTVSGYVDGVLADSTTFEEMPKGDIGPYAETTDETGIIVDFLRLTVYAAGD